MTNVKTALAVFMSIILWASAFIAIKVGVANISPIQIASVRFIIASIVIVPIAVINKVRKPSNKDLIIMAIAGLAGFVIYNILLAIGMKTVDAGTACFVVNISPAFISMLAVILYKEKVLPKTWISILICIIGVGVLSLQVKNVNYKIGILYILGASLCHSVYIVIQKKIIKRNTILEITCYSIWFGAITLLLIASKEINVLLFLKYKLILILVYLAVFPTIIGCLCWSYAISKIKYHKLAIFLNLIPIAVVILNYILLNKSITINGLFGSMIIMFGVLNSQDILKFK